MKTKHCSFFQNRECEFFPCHATDDPANFNCLFCFCPLYCLTDCGGSYTYTRSGIKDCSACMLPHQRDNYAVVLKRLNGGKKEAHSP